jgi:hypothetical protein
VLLGYREPSPLSGRLLRMAYGVMTEQTGGGGSGKSSAVMNGTECLGEGMKVWCERLQRLRGEKRGISSA